MIKIITLATSMFFCVFEHAYPKSYYTQFTLLATVNAGGETLRTWTRPFKNIDITNLVVKNILILSNASLKLKDVLSSS